MDPQKPTCYGKNWEAANPICAGGLDPTATANSGGTYVRERCHFYGSCANASNTLRATVQVNNLIRQQGVPQYQQVQTVQPQPAPQVQNRPFSPYYPPARPQVPGIPAPNLRPQVPQMPQVQPGQQFPYYAPMYMPGVVQVPEVDPSAGLRQYLVHGGITILRAAVVAIGLALAEYISRTPFIRK